MGAGKVLLIIGAVLTGIALIMIIVGVAVLSSGTSYTNPEDEKVGEGTGTITASLKAGTTYQVWTKSSSLVTVTITDSSGTDVSYSGFAAIQRDGYSPVAEFTTNGAGSYTIKVTDIYGTDAKGLVTNQIDTTDELEDTGTGIVAWIFGWCGGLALGIPGIILLIIGIILTVTQKKKETPAVQPAAEAPVPGQPAPGSYEAMYGTPPPQQPPQTPY